jgi:predicted O-methyltransferase YrrM
VPYPVRRYLNKYRGRPEAEYQALCRRLEVLRLQYDELCRLCELKSSPCDTSALGTLAATGIPRLFHDSDVGRDWEADSRTLESLQLPEMTGGVNPGDQRAIYYLVRKLRPKRVLEIGTHVGCSTLNMTLALKRLRAGQTPLDARLLSVDVRDVNDAETKPWLKFGAASSPQQMVERVGGEPFVAFRVADSLAFLEAPGEPFDFIFLDGDHTAERVYREIPLALKRLQPGGFILLHDYFPDLQPLWSNGALITGPAQAVRRFRAEGCGFQVYPLGALPWPVKLGSNVTSLALLVSG